MRALSDCPGLPRSEWEIFLCRAHELVDFKPAEYGRHVPRIRQAVARWRSQTSDQSFEALMALDCPVNRAPLRNPVITCWPEWPERSCVFVDGAERLRRWNIMCPGWTSPTRIAWQLEPDSLLLLDTEEAFKSLVRQLQRNLKSRKKLGTDPSDFEEHRLMCTQWWQTDAELVRQYAAWLKENSPTGRKIYGLQQGAGTFERKARYELKCLSAWRILRVTSWDRAPELYATQSEWSQARGRAQEVIDRLILHPGI
jgi:hypothetical protein